MASKKEKERHCVDVATRCLGWQAVIEKSEERPDFHLRFVDGTVVGLELQYLVNETTASGVPAITRFCKAVQKHLDGDTCFVWVSFFREAVSDIISGKAMRTQAEVLANVIKERLRHRPAPFIISRSDPALAGRVSVATVTVNPAATLSVWGGHLTDALRVHHIAAAIAGKDQKLSSYERLQPDAQMWLLLVTEGASPAWDDIVAQKEFRSAFDRAFIVDMQESRAIELRLAPVAAPP